MAMIRKVEKANTIAEVQPTVATLERLYLEYGKGVNESTDEDIKLFRAHDISTHADLFRILPDSVIKDLRWSYVSPEKSFRESFLKTVQQLVKDNMGPAPMELDALRCHSDKKEKMEESCKYDETSECGNICKE